MTNLGTRKLEWSQYFKEEGLTQERPKGVELSVLKLKRGNIRIGQAEGVDQKVKDFPSQRPSGFLEGRQGHMDFMLLTRGARATKMKIRPRDEKRVVRWGLSVKQNHPPNRKRSSGGTLRRFETLSASYKKR